MEYSWHFARKEVASANKFWSLSLLKFLSDWGKQGGIKHFGLLINKLRLWLKINIVFPENSRKCIYDYEHWKREDKS